MRGNCIQRSLMAALVAATTLPFLTAPLGAQPISLDAATGGWLNPWALVSPSKEGEIGKLSVAHHSIDAGPVVGNVNAASVAVGFNANMEAGFSRYFLDGPTPVISTDLDVASFKWNIVAAEGDTPAISVGAIRRWSGSRNLGTTDFYGVATRVFSLGSKSKQALLLNGGLRSSEAAIFGIAGTAAEREALPFGTAALVLNEHLTLGVVLTDQPGTDTNRSIFARLIPGDDDNLQILVAVARVDDALQAGEQLAASVTYRY
ncbi:MAG: DUF3034 family protein [Candidatus Wallbacteria bacterium]|nr:DUF3034 family protein [Candidatus Wallbacteria bacterium]